MKLIDKLTKYLLIILLAITVVGNLMMAIINPEAYLMASKLEGSSAKIYLSLNLMIALLFIYAVNRIGRIIWSILLTIFFGFHLINSIITSITFFGNLSISGISLIGVIISMVEVFRALALR
ncbi:MAG: hypothetical protein J7J19_02205 [Thaumarchaeota archaeon]|nr:hypothetical protein [Nitrososphaerota archaeon]